MVNSVETYKLFAEYYDLYVGNYADDLEFYSSLCSGYERILEIGCGTGRVLKYLLNSNYKVTGIDISDEMLNLAKSKLEKYFVSKQLTLLNHDFSDKALETKYDIALITFYTFNYIINNPVVFLKNVNKSLKQNAVLVMDLFFPQSMNQTQKDKQWQEHEFIFNSRKIKLKGMRWMKGDVEHRVQIYSENGKEIEIETERKYYNPSEIKDILVKAGFSNIEFSLTFDKNMFSAEADEKKLIKNFAVRAEKV